MKNLNFEIDQNNDIVLNKNNGSTTIDNANTQTINVMYCKQINDAIIKKIDDEIEFEYRGFKRKVAAFTSLTNENTYWNWNYNGQKIESESNDANIMYCYNNIGKVDGIFLIDGQEQCCDVYIKFNNFNELDELLNDQEFLKELDKTGYSMYRFPDYIENIVEKFLNKKDYSNIDKYTDITFIDLLQYGSLKDIARFIYWKLLNNSEIIKIVKI